MFKVINIMHNIQWILFMYQWHCNTSSSVLWHLITCLTMPGRIWWCVTFRATDPTPSLSPLETLCRCIVDHQTLPVVRSLFPSGQFLSQPESSGTLPYAKSPLPYPWHFTCQWTPFKHMYTHPRSHITVTHRADTICSVFLVTCSSHLFHMLLLLFHMSFLNLPHAHCPSLPIMFQIFSI